MRVIETTVDDDLAPFCAYLRQRRLAHRVFEERGVQVVEIADPAHAETVLQAFRDWRSGDLVIEPPRPRPSTRWSGALRRYPGLSALVGAALLAFPFGYLLAQGRLTDVGAWLTIVDPRRFGEPLPSLWALLLEGQVWRWFTPMFLHFSVWHLGFNCAIVVELGRRIEGAHGGGVLWGLVLVLGAVSNLAQFAFGGGPLFGGLSGVAYGMLGYVLVRHRLAPAAAPWRLPPGLPIVLLAFLVIFSLGVTEPFGLFVANAAHWGGLTAGAAAGVVAGTIQGGR
jgi:GlpG protein